MNKILLNFLIKEFLKTLSYVILIFYSFGIILNLFEEIEFFKNLDVSFMLPLTLTGIFIPSMIIKILPFIIFISSMWFMVKIRNNRDLITLKVFGFSNFKIFYFSIYLIYFRSFCINFCKPNNFVYVKIL